MAKPFLTAEWKKLVLLNYEANPELLEQYVPFGTELDLWKGKCYVSLVGFMFLNTRVKGFKIPMHVNFEEVNLRFYVKHKTDEGEIKRGVVFIKEIVPRPMITMVANTIYKEHYETLAMDHHWEISEDEIKVGYKWYNDNREHSILVSAPNKPFNFEAGSTEEFITQHFWGYTKLDERSTSEYEVQHPAWKVYPVNRAAINVDFSLTYGEDFLFLNNQQPSSVMLAEGSEISVGNKRIIS
jgi:uncharacterized protein YqjF (DUF2071 family)